MYTIREIATLTEATITPVHPAFLDRHIAEVDFDSRRLTANSLFVALSIGTTDGHLYIEEAIQRGAIAAFISDPTVVARSYSRDIPFLLVENTLTAFQQLASAHRKALNIPIIAITGSNGKTTTKDMVSHLFSHKLNVHKTQGNFNNHLGVPLTLLQAGVHHDVVVLEMGMNHSGELDLLGRISTPDYVIITNIGESHIEHLGSREGIAHAKGEVLSHLGSNGKALIPWDSEFKELLASKTASEKIFFHVKESPLETIENNELVAHSIEANSNGTNFHYHQGSCELPSLRIPLFGTHNVHNALPSIFLAREFGFTDEEISDGMNGMVISPMRFQLVEGGNGATIINDAYNASPTSMEMSSLTFLSTFTDKKRVLVLGDMYELGSESVALHQKVGYALNKERSFINCLVTIGTHSEATSSVYKGAYRHFNSKEEALAYLRLFLSPEFALLFKGSRGMQLETIVDSLLEK